jgi:hypothetical protein
MKTMIFAAVAVISLGDASAYAGGIGAGSNVSPPVYASQAFSDHSRDPEVHFLGQGTVFAKIFGHSDSDQAVAAKAATTSVKGG